MQRRLFLTAQPQHSKGPRMIMDTLKRLALGLTTLALTILALWSTLSAIGWAGNEASLLLGSSTSDFQFGLAQTFGRQLWIQGIDFLLMALFSTASVLWVCGVAYYVPYCVGGAVQDWIASRLGTRES